MSFDADPRPTGSLLSDAVNQLTRLVRGEVALAKAEVAQNIRSAGLGAGFLVGAIVLVFVALNVLVFALVAALGELIGPGWSALIVGVIILVVAAILAMRGLNALKPENLAPSRTVRNVQADAQTIKENVSNGNH
ncbi:MAG TPA: phage holin family protein [Rubellimicrobium sp.]|nr:phage holin family protein [Rubellimicrobium sp.]